MARSQFSFQKRQKELAKKKKKEEKLARKQERKDTGAGKGPDIAMVNEFGEVIEPEPGAADHADAEDQDDTDRS